MSTGTNRERLEQNNTLLEDIKTQIQNLPEAGGSGDINLFETQEEMNNSTGNKEGDLAVVYRSEVQNVTADSKFQVATFPETVVLDTAMTDYVDVRYRAVDGSMFDCMGSLDSSRFNMDCYTNSGSIRIQYTSSDGITYTRTDSTGNPVDFGTEIYYDMPERWNDVIGKFIQIGGSTFEGLFEYKLGVFNYSACLLSELTVLDNKLHRGATYILVDKDKINTAISNAISYMKSEMNMTFSGGDAGTVLMKDADTLVFIFGANNTIPGGGRRLELTVDTNTNTVTGLCTSDSFNGCMLVEFDIHTGSYIKHTFDTLETTLSGNKATTKYNQYYLLSYYNSDSKKLQPSMYCITGASTGNRYGNVYEYESLKYVFADTQLNATIDTVYDKVFYGKNGVESGTLQNKENLTIKQVQEKVTIWNNFNEGIICPSDMISAFFNYTNLKTIPLLDTSNVTIMEGMFVSCTSLTAIPLIDTSNVKIMTNIFRNCTNLTTIPLLNTSSVTNINSMFYGCPNLSDESLNNILAMCTNATKITSNKTLKYIGLSSEQANKCKTLSNYSAFTSAGWTTGY